MNRNGRQFRQPHSNEIDPYYSRNDAGDYYELQAPSTSGGLRSSFLRRNDLPYTLESEFEEMNHRNRYHDSSREIYYADSNNIPMNELPRHSTHEYDYVNYDNRQPVTRGVHSIHRNRNLNSQNLKQSHQARTGGRNQYAADANYDVLEHHANQIVYKMQKDQDLMTDSPEAEKLRQETLRDMPQCLTIKRSVKNKITSSVKRSRKKIGCYTSLKYKYSLAFTKLKADVKNLVYVCELWYGSLKKIEGHFGSGVASFFKFLRWIFIMNCLITILTVAFIVLPQATFVDSPVNTEPFKFKDLLTGDGYLKHTLLYYGFYSNTSVSVSKVTYNMPVAYFSISVLSYLFCLIFLSRSVFSSYKISFIETEGGLKNVFANKVFCGWDFNIATNEAAKLKSSAIYHELKELLAETQTDQPEVPFCKRCCTLFAQLLTNLSILAGLAAIGYLIWYYLDKKDDIVTSVIVNLIMFLVPMFFSLVVKYEGYSPKTSLYITLARTFLLGGVIIAVLVVFWLKNTGHSTCWETALGQEIYRLVLIDFFVSVVCYFLLTVGYFYAKRLFNSKKSNLEFDISIHTMQIIYNQSLFWMGLLYSPLLCVMVIIKLFLAWYIKQATCLWLCKPSSKSWRAAQNQTWFMIMVLVSLLLCSSFQGYIIMKIRPSCGPFSGYNYIYELITDWVLQIKNGGKVFEQLLLLLKPGSVAMILIGFSVVVYYLRAKAIAQREIVETYREMLVWESKDKEFLIEKISLMDKDWKYKLKDGREFDPVNEAPVVQNNVDEFYSEGPSYTNPNMSFEYQKYRRP